MPSGVVQAISNDGHDVAWIGAVAPGSPDTSVLSQAQTEERILLTFDKDFGELALRLDYPR